MKRSSVITAVVTAVAALLLTSALTAAAAGATKTPSLRTSVRVSHSCTVTITVRWSNMSQSVTYAGNDLYYNNNYWDYQSSSTASGTRGSYKTVWQGTPSATLHSIGGASYVYDSVDGSGGWVYGDVVYDQAYCEAPFTPVSS